MVLWTMFSFHHVDMGWANGWFLHQLLGSRGKSSPPSLLPLSIAFLGTSDLSDTDDCRFQAAET